MSGYTLSAKAKQTLTQTVRTVNNLPANLTGTKLNRKGNINAYATKAIITGQNAQTNTYRVALYADGYNVASTGTAQAEIVGISYIGEIPTGTKVLVFANSITYTGDSV